MELNEEPIDFFGPSTQATFFFSPAKKKRGESWFGPSRLCTDNRRVCSLNLCFLIVRRLRLHGCLGILSTVERGIWSGSKALLSLAFPCLAF